MPTGTLLSIPPDAAPSPEVVAEAVRRLAAGEVIALPTETVYGLAARADDAEALGRLTSLKGRSKGHPLTWHVADDAPVVAAAELSGLVGRIADRYWPGPLTLVLEGEFEGLEQIVHDGWTGVRLPAHAGTRAILAACDFPIVATSANASGTPPLTDGPAVRAAFGRELELVLDGGPSQLAQSSTVLAVGRGRFELLREGILSAEDLRRVAGLRIAFVCTGNTCRSPMAEALAREALAERLGVPPEDLHLFGMELWSAGVFAHPGAPASEQAIDVLTESGIDLSRHRSRPAIDREVAATDRVYCMTASHRDALLQLLPPGAADHVELLDPFGEDVPDPFGGSREQYARTADRLRELVEMRLSEWL